MRVEPGPCQTLNPREAANWLEEMRPGRHRQSESIIVVLLVGFALSITASLALEATPYLRTWIRVLVVAGAFLFCAALASLAIS